MMFQKRDDAPWAKSGSPKPSRFGNFKPQLNLNRGLLGLGGDSGVSETTPLKAAPDLQRSASSDFENDDDDDEHKANAAETFIHLVKGYLGAGCLSLPWAVSQLGLFWGAISIFAMSAWSSYNCWTVVKLKRYIERSTPYLDDRASEASSVGTTNTNITYPDVGDWAYGANFQSYISACVCTQQLAICTVFVSFVGENLLALLEQLDVPGFIGSHTGVMTLALPFIMSLCFVPTIKQMTPFLAGGTALLFASFVAVGIIIVKMWGERPEETPMVNPPQMPLALCAILYSYEGINIIIPVEAAMAKPKQFKAVFLLSMATVALILAGFACICVIAFGDVTSGSMTAFLLQKYSDDASVQFWLMVANTAVSLSVLMTYPLQLFPALELIAPMINRNGEKDDLDDDDDDFLADFEPLPVLPEHGVADMEDLPPMEHDYEAEDDYEGNASTADGSGANDQDSASVGATSAITALIPTMVMEGDSPQLRAGLVFLTYAIAVIVPNVQSLISLAGALAGSSTALLIPPLLELAYLKHLEHDGTDATTALLRQANANTTISATPSAVLGEAIVPPANPTNPETDPAIVQADWCLGSPMKSLGKWWFEKLKNYFLLFIGLIFFGIGTFASIHDIVKIYLSDER